MSATPVYLKEPVEQAFQAVLAGFQTEDLRGWRIVARWFGYREKTPVISCVVGEVKPSVEAEDGTPVLYETPVEFSVKSHMNDEDATAHKDVVAAIAGIFGSGSETITALNTAMAGGEKFTALLWTPGAHTDNTEDKIRIGTFSGTLHFVPWSAA